MRTLRLRLKQLFQLTLSEQIILLAALIVLPLTAASLRVFGFKRCQRVLSRISSRPKRKSPTLLQRAGVTARTVAIAANHGPYRAKCLVRSMTTQFLLSCQGIDSVLRIGISKPRGLFEAHAWVICEGKIINDHPDIESHYRPFTATTRTAD